LCLTILREEVKEKKISEVEAENLSRKTHKEQTDFKKERDLENTKKVEG
jgi:hypothetical protein